MRIEGANNPNNHAHVDRQGRLETHASSVSEQTVSSIQGDTYNLNTGNLNITVDTEVPIFYIKNLGEDRAFIIPRVFVNTGPSSGGSGPSTARIMFNPTTGTLLQGTDLDIHNFNAGSGKEISATVKINDGLADTISGGTTPFQFFYPESPFRELTPFEAIILPRGSSMALLYTPPTGNTGIDIQAGLNLYLEAD